jgi:protein-L-isoaspartate(D-aspartate) O-methyltransferase
VLTQLFSQIVTISICFIFILAESACSAESAKEISFDSLRQKMLQEQIVARGIEDVHVLRAMLKVPRHKFVPAHIQRFAYQDSPLPIGYGQTISQPYIVALMSELAHLGPTDKVLEIGTGSGYQAAVLAEIVHQVYTVEILEELAKSSRKRLSELGYENIQVKWGDGYLGWEEFAPYDAIIVTAAPDKVPKALKEQLKIGGRLVIPVGSLAQELKLIIKTETGLEEKSVIPVRFVPMIKSEGTQTYGTK